MVWYNVAKKHSAQMTRLLDNEWDQVLDGMWGFLCEDLLWSHVPGANNNLMKIYDVILLSDDEYASGW